MSNGPEVNPEQGALLRCVQHMHKDLDGWILIGKEEDPWNKHRRGTGRGPQSLMRMLSLTVSFTGLLWKPCSKQCFSFFLGKGLLYTEFIWY